jgi:hypothetical protein
MNFRCKGNCGDCVNKVADNPSRREGVETLPYNTRGAFYKDDALIEEKCKCMECYDEDSGKYKYWVGEPELMKYFENAECGIRGAE